MDSVWQGEKRRQRYPALKGNKRTHVLVIGGCQRSGFLGVKAKDLLTFSVRRGINIT